MVGKALQEHGAVTKLARGDAETAIKWVLQEYRDSPHMFEAFLDAWTDGSVATELEWSEYRYWMTGVHEPDHPGEDLEDTRFNN